MGENVGDISELSLLHVLLDRIQWFLCCYLGIEEVTKMCEFIVHLQHLCAVDLKEKAYDCMTMKEKT